jgi:hypothetical protein
MRMLRLSFRKPRETAYATVERKFFEQNPSSIKVIIPSSKNFPQADVVLAKMVSGNPQTGQIVARIEQEPFKFNRDRFSKGDLVLVKKRNPKEWSWVVRKIDSPPKDND